MEFKTIFIAIIASLLFSCNEKDEFQKISITDVLLQKPKPGEWLADHPENGQTFEEYSRLTPMKPNKNRNTIYILPLGEFTPQESKIIDLTVEYLELFYGIKTVRMHTMKDDVIPDDKRRLNEMNSEQLHAGYLIENVIPDLKPKNALVIMALTSKDLYPKPSWNYVFGLATYSDGIGVTSIFRYDPNNKDYRIGLHRTIKTSAHEIGHMFKLKHCTHALCVMNGVNSLSEDDRKPNSLCSVCLKKMTWNFGFNTKERLQKLMAFYERHHLSDDIQNVKVQYEQIQ